MKPDCRHWPLLLREVAERIDEAAALKLAASYGGQKIMIPRKADGSEIARKLGMPIAKIVVEHYGGGTAYIPNLALKRAVERRRFILTHRHLTANACAALLGVSSRWVEKVRASTRDEPFQSSFFDG